MTEEQAHQRPGDEASLHALYAAVPSAEEIDLADGLAPPRQLPAFDVPRADDDPAAADDIDDPDGLDDEDVTPLTDGQARGVLEHLLGAEPVEEDPDEEK